MILLINQSVFWPSTECPINQIIDASETEIVKEKQSSLQKTWIKPHISCGLQYLYELFDALKGTVYWCYHYLCFKDERHEGE